MRRGTAGVRAGIFWMAWEWLLSAAARPALEHARSLFTRLSGQEPHLNFQAGFGSVELRVQNQRKETIILEGLTAKPNILGFSAGHSVDDIARAMIDRHFPEEAALAVVDANEVVELLVIQLDGFKKSPPATKIKVGLRWRTSRRGFRSERVSKIITSVRDIRDLAEFADKKKASRIGGMIA